MSGNLFVERNWTIPKDYLAIEDKKEDAAAAKPPPVEESKMGEQTSTRKEESVAGDPIVPFVKLKRRRLIFPINKRISSRSPYLNHKPKGPIH